MKVLKHNVTDVPFLFKFDMSTQIFTDTTGNYPVEYLRSTENRSGTEPGMNNNFTFYLQSFSIAIHQCKLIMEMLQR